MITPPTLKKGDQVAIVAPSRKVSPEQMASTLKLLHSWDLSVVIPDNLYSEYNQFAGDDNTRTHMLQDVLDDSDIHAVICARGGYGSVRIIDNLDLSLFRKHPKWIIGYSDVTVLHSHLSIHTDIATLHATMPIDITSNCTDNVPSIASLHNCLFSTQNHISFNSFPLNRQGTASAPIVGGNLSILYSLCGSSSDIDTTNKILFIEDLDEYLYHIDRMMQNLKRTGKLDHLKGLVVGPMKDMHDNTIPFGLSAEEIIFDAVKDYDYPVCFNAPIGHIGTENHALFLGANTSLIVKDSGCEIHQSLT